MVVSMCIWFHANRYNFIFNRISVR